LFVRQLLANLWARGAALQCCFSQELIDLVIPVYHGSTEPDSIFDPSLLSAAVARIKNREAGDGQVEPAMHPIDVLRDRCQPLPHLTILMELDYEAPYQETGLKIKCQVSEPVPDGEFGKLRDACEEAVKEHRTYGRNKKIEKGTLKRLKEKADNAQLAADSCNRYSISVRGTSPNVYGVLRKLQTSFRPCSVSSCRRLVKRTARESTCDLSNACQMNLLILLGRAYTVKYDNAEAEAEVMLVSPWYHGVTAFLCVCT
jgi:hypothetical protein